MKIVVGLGNPGPKYETTRHNAGFLALDRLIERWNATGPQNKFSGEFFMATVGGEKVTLIKPQTYMNLSGQCVGSFFSFYKCNPDDMIVIHDDVDLETNIIKIKTGGGTAGHKGLKSIDASIGAENNAYHRIRIGIGRPQPPMEVEDYVLQLFSDQDLGDLDNLFDKICDAAEFILTGKVNEAMNLFNRKEKKES